MTEYSHKCADIFREKNPFSSIATIKFKVFLPKLWHSTSQLSQTPVHSC